MIVPQFIRFYKYDLEAVLDMAAVSFFSLVNAMLQLSAVEKLDNIATTAIGFGGDKSGGALHKLEKQAAGLGQLVREVDTIRSIKK